MRIPSRTAALFAALVVSATASWAQGATGTVQGVVRSETRSIEAVTVTIVGTTLGTQTRSDGKFTITNVPVGAQVIRTSRIGYARKDQPVTIVAGQTLTVNFDLTIAAFALEHILVTGYGSSERRDVTGSISSVSSADIATLPVPRVDQAISGLVAGVQVQTTNSQPGSEMRIRIRGGNSLNGSNEPLVVVDGVIGAGLNQINPNDVESVDVLGAEPRAQRLAFQTLRHDVRGASVIPDVVDGQHVGVIQCAGGERFVLKRTHSFAGVRRMRKKQLDRDVAPEPLVARPPHLAHPACAQPPLDGVRGDPITSLNTPPFASDLPREDVERRRSEKVVRLLHGCQE